MPTVYKANCIKRFIRLVLCPQRTHNLANIIYKETGVMIEVRTKCYRNMKNGVMTMIKQVRKASQGKRC